MRRIAILSPRYDTHDAVGTDGLEMHRILNEAGFESRLFAAGWSVKEPVSDAAGVKDYLTGQDDILLYHYAVAWDAGREIFRSFPGKKILRYHNVTPARYFEPYHQGIAQSCRAGREELARFIQCENTYYLPASKYNERELLSLGAPAQRSRILSPFHRIEAIQREEANISLIRRYNSHFPVSSNNFLMVGRIVPNKGYHHLLHAFHTYRSRLDDCGRLILVGKKDRALHKYNRELQSILRDTGEGAAVNFIHDADDPMLKAAYLSARALVVMSEHEGFSLPVLEAMALGVPVIALGGTAVEDTLGGCGILLDKPDPYLFAAAMERVVQDASLSAVMACEGRERYLKVFHPDLLRGKLLRIMEEWNQ